MQNESVHQNMQRQADWEGQCSRKRYVHGRVALGFIWGMVQGPSGLRWSESRHLMAVRILVRGDSPIVHYPESFINLSGYVRFRWVLPARIRTFRWAARHLFLELEHDTDLFDRDPLIGGHGWRDLPKLAIKTLLSPMTQALRINVVCRKTDNTLTNLLGPWDRRQHVDSRNQFNKSTDRI